MKSRNKTNLTTVSWLDQLLRNPGTNGNAILQGAGFWGSLFIQIDSVNQKSIR